MSRSNLPNGIPADLRYAVQFSPDRYRTQLASLATLYHEIREIIHECRDPGVAETKLRWWEEEIELMLDGRARHPCAQSFWAQHGKLNLASKLFLDIIDSTRQDIHSPSFPTFDNVRRYCKQRGGSFTVLAASLCGADSLVTLAAARDLGSGWQLADIVTRSAMDARLGRVYFAAEDLQQHHLDQHVVEGVHSDTGLKALLSDYSLRARQLMDDALAAAPEMERDTLVTASILAALAQGRLRKLARRHFVTGAGTVELSPLSALLTAWKTAQRAVKITL
ncbi:MAG TPA: squalene/phytoene synthase family protein [Gammaproteobacteria bacterium]|nr:squalene/phytoene synthase family protein [Gammaproteobacteria bacterium]